MSAPTCPTHHTPLTPDPRPGRRGRCNACRRARYAGIRAKVPDPCPSGVATLAAAVERLAAPFAGAAKPVRPPRVADRDLLAVYPMGDPHLGMYAWARETGEDFDLTIAERQLVRVADELVGRAPPAHTALVVNLGDFFHADNNSNQTARSGHALDVDTRWAKVLGVGVRTMRRVIDRALERHRHVRVICAIGNHDDHSAVMLALCLAQYYEREPRVEVETAPGKFHWHTHGTTLLGVTHGDTVRLPQLPGIMATDQPVAWGASRYRYWYVGHVHHDRLVEYPGCVVETFRTLAPRDAWHTAHGYRAGRDMKCDVIHRNRGRVTRLVVPA